MYVSKSGKVGQMESVIEDIKKNREKATEVIEAAESRRDESGGKLDVPGCSRHLNMRFIMEEGAGAVE